MKLKDFKNEIKVLDITALMGRAKALKIELSDLVMDKNINRIKNLKSISGKRKDLARVLTTLNQKQMIESLEVSKVPEVPKVSKAEKTEKEKKGVDKK
jgi:ribosomal protein L29